MVGPLLGVFTVLVMVSRQYVFAEDQHDIGDGQRDIVIKEDGLKAGQHVGENLETGPRSSKRRKSGSHTTATVPKDHSTGHWSIW